MLFSYVPSLFPFLTLKRGLISAGFICAVKELISHPGLRMAVWSLSSGSQSCLWWNILWGPRWGRQGRAARISAVRIRLSSSTPRAMTSSALAQQLWVSLSSSSRISAAPRPAQGMVELAQPGQCCSRAEPSWPLQGTQAAQLPEEKPGVRDLFSAC